MIIYNITFHIDQEILAEALSFLKKDYLPKASAGGFLLNPCLRRVHTPSGENEGESYCVQFHVKNRETLNYWLENEGNSIHKVLVGRFGHKMAGFTTLLDEIDWEND